MKTILFPSIIFCLFMGTLSLTAQIGGSQEFTPDYIEYHAKYVPVTPNASSFTVYGNIPINTATGVPQINIPIFNIVEDGVSVPISLSYNASGVMVDQLSGVAGLNWSLNAGGGIFRQVNDKPDETGWLIPEHRGYIDHLWGLENSYDSRFNQVSILDDSAQNDDYFPDDFSYNFAGNSGAFIFDKEGSITKEHVNTILLEKLDGVGEFMYFRARDGLGNTYFFEDALERNGTTVITAAESEGGVSLSADLNSGYEISGWMMDRILTRNGREISFTYEPYDLQYTIFNVSDSFKFADCITAGGGQLDLGEGIACGCVDEPPFRRTSRASTSIDYRPRNQLIRTIDAPTVRVTFDYEEDTSLSTWQKKLTSITILDKLGNKTRSFVLTYGKFDGDPRLRLDRVQEVGFDGTTKPPYSFTYAAGNLPQKGSRSKDFKGYYNGKANLTLVPETEFILQSPLLFGGIHNFLGDRDPDIGFLKIGTLETIEYPTGGSTDFSYGANIGDIDTDRYTGGLRIETIIDKDSDGSTVKRTDYSYSGLNGYSPGSSLFGTYRSYGKKIIFSSDNLNLHPILIRSGHFYEEVTIEQVGEGENIRNVNRYSAKANNKSFDSQMVRQEMYRGDLLVRSTDMEYSRARGKRVQYWTLGHKDYCYTVPEADLLRVYLGYNFPVSNIYNQYRDELVKSTQIDYFENGAGEFSANVTQNRYTYNEHLLTSSQELDGRLLAGSLQDALDGNFDPDPTGPYAKIEYTYPKDHIIEDPLITVLAQDHFTSIPISKKTYRNGNLVLGQFMEYDPLGNVTAVYRYNKGLGTNNATSGHIPQDYELHSSFMIDRGKPVQVLRDRGNPTAMIWDPSKNYLMAELQNVSKADLDAVLPSVNIQTGSGEQLVTSEGIDFRIGPQQLQSLRAILKTAFPKALITTYSYEPLVGVVEVTDPKGYNMSYEYDGLGRLEYVRDGEGKLVSENKYNYKDQN